MEKMFNTKRKETERICLSNASWEPCLPIQRVRAFPTGLQELREVFAPRLQQATSQTPVQGACEEPSNGYRAARPGTPVKAPVVPRTLFTEHRITAETTFLDKTGLSTRTPQNCTVHPHGFETTLTKGHGWSDVGPRRLPGES